MKKILSVLLTLCLVMGVCVGCGEEMNADTTVTTVPTTTVTVPETTQAPVDYANSTVILYSANTRGDVRIFSAMAAAKAAYQALGATVYLVDAGNYMRGSGYANVNMGLNIYTLMQAAGYEVLGMGVGELSYGEAEIGYTDHGDLTKYYTQAELYRGTESLTYQRNAPWHKAPVMVKRPEKEAAGLSVICSNLAIGEDATGYYDFDASIVLEGKLKIGFVCSIQEDAAQYVREGFLQGYTYQPVTAPECDILVSLGGGEGDIVIPSLADDECSAGACVINNSTGQIHLESVDLSGKHPVVEAWIAALEVPEVLGVAPHTYAGSVAATQNSQTDLGALVADALKWYAETQMEGIEYPVIGIQNGGNCVSYIYRGDITRTDIRNAIHASAAGVGVIYITGAQLMETLEAATQQANCSGWANVSGIAYTVDTAAAYDGAHAYGPYYKAGSVNRVSITTEGFDPEATYAVIADMLLLSGSDTYYIFKDCNVVAKAENGLNTCDIVAMYLQTTGGNGAA